jgi:protein phosphatase
MCSDGLSDMLSDEEIASTLKEFGGDLESVCSTLIQRANTHGGKDNVSVILVKVVAVDTKPKKILDRMLKWMK